MNQNSRTLGFVAVAVVACLAAYFIQPGSATVSSDVTFNEVLFPKFTDPTSAASLEIKRFNVDKSEIDEFSVVKKGQVWSLPSHEGYPADAKDQMVEAALAVADLTITGTVPESGDADARARFGVLEPTIENLAKSGTESLGTHVIMRNAQNADLANFVIGKTVPEKPDQRYVAVPNQSRIVTVKIAAEKLSTKFNDWIETDLLKLGSVWDISKLLLQDYSVDASRRAFDPRSLMIFSRNQEKNEWKIDELREFDAEKKDFLPLPPGKDEELNQQALDDMRSALNELKIVNVNRKPAGFGQSLAEGKFAVSQEDQESLGRRGFYLREVPGGGITLLSSDGELNVSMNDGVEYELRFGAVADIATVEASKDAAKKDDKKDADKKDADKKDADKKDATAATAKTSLERYLFVTARYNDEMIPKPKLQKLPEANAAPPAEGDKKEAAKDESKKDDAKKDETKKEEDKKDEAKKDEAKPDAATKPEGDKPAADTKDAPKDDKKPEEGKKPEEPKVASRDGGSDRLRLTSYVQDADAAAQDKKADAKAADAPAASEPKANDAKPDAPKADAPKTDAPKADAPKADAPKTEAPPVEPKPAAPAADAPPAKSPADAAKDLEAERKRIEAENKREQEQYDNKVKAAQKKVKELNERFADWYYVIPEDVYKKIHLNRAAVIKKKEKPAETGKPGGAAGLPELPFKIPGAN